MVYGAVGIADDCRFWVVGHAAIGPVMDAIHGRKVIRLARRPGIYEDVVQPAGIPDARIFQVGYALWENRRALRLVGPKDPLVANEQPPVALCELEFLVGTRH